MELNGYLDAELEKSIGVLEVFPDPGRIMFAAYENQPSPMAMKKRLNFNNEVLNVGGHLDLATGVFTSPVDGTFKFTFSGVGDLSSFDIVNVYVNDESVFKIFNDDGEGRTNIAYSWFLQLQKNDEVKLNSFFWLYVDSATFYHFTCVQLK